MIIISSKIRLDAMSKVISFSISDRYLAKIRSLYPGLTDNLAAKQFLTDRLDAGLSSSLDASLDDGLDGKLETMIQTRLDGLLDERLDAVMGKLVRELTERLTRLESRLDDGLDGNLDDGLDGNLDDGLDGNLDDGLDDMEPLLRLQREASIATSPLPPSPPDRPAIETLPTVETVSTDSSIEPVTDAIETVRGDTDPIESVTGEAVTIKPWYTVKELLDCHYPGWPGTRQGLQEKADREQWPKRTRRGSKGNPCEYQAVLPD
jgi:hypothetical protein